MTHQERFDGLFSASKQKLVEHIEGLRRTYVADFESAADYGLKMRLFASAPELSAEEYIKEALGAADLRNCYVVPTGDALVVFFDTMNDKEFFTALLRKDVDF